MGRKTLLLIRREPVLAIAGAAAAVSAFFVPPDGTYREYIDGSVLSMLFCLMLVIGGLVKVNLVQAASERLLRRVDSTRTLTLSLVGFAFFTAMLVTNDVSLLLMVPMTIGIFGNRRPDTLVFTLVMETLAANLGSMVTPIGNPQNLYLYAAYQMKMTSFFRTVLPVAGASLVLIAMCILLHKSEALESLDVERTAVGDRRTLAVCLALFALCVLSVLRLADDRVALAVTVAAVLLTDRELFRRVDYCLLLTFVAFFVFVGNLGRIDAVREAVSGVIAGREFLGAVLTSQVISNVPAAVMLSGFTENSKALLLGTNIGGLGTLVASLASLISFRLYAKSDGARPEKYLGVFTAYNAVFLLVLTGFGLILCR